MRSVLFTLLLGCFTYFVSDSMAFGAVKPDSKVFAFEYAFEGSSFTYRTPASDWSEAFERGAQACFKFFKNGQPLGEDRGLGLIDTCANPREKKGT